MKALSLTLALSILASSAIAQAPFPQADRNGNYSGNVGHEKWVIVDPDPNGLNCRWSSTMPRDWYSPSAKLPPLNVNQWSVVRRFQKNSTVKANLAPAGFAVLRDTNGNPWLKVSIGANDQICLVRANDRYIKPVR